MRCVRGASGWGSTPNRGVPTLCRRQTTQTMTPEKRASTQAAFDSLQTFCDELHDDAVRALLEGEDLYSDALWDILHDATTTLLKVKEAVNGNTE